MKHRWKIDDFELQAKRMKDGFACAYVLTHFFCL